jgi:plasmid stabilization system protein ParE
MREGWTDMVDEATDSPDGVQVEVLVIDDELTAEERTELHASLDRALADSRTPKRDVEWTLGTASSSTRPAAKVVLLDEARAQFEAEHAWWRENRDAKERLVAEFVKALEQLSSMPETGQRYRDVRGKLIQRILMKKPRCHIRSFADRMHDRLENTVALGHSTPPPKVVNPARKNCRHHGLGVASTWGCGLALDPCRQAREPSARR